jgi:hypothetical protein
MVNSVMVARLRVLNEQKRPRTRRTSRHTAVVIIPDWEAISTPANQDRDVSFEGSVISYLNIASVRKSSEKFCPTNNCVLL